MGREEEIRLIAYGLRTREGTHPRSFLERWLKAESIWEYNQKAIAATGEPNRPPSKDDRSEETSGSLLATR
jgi:hypothetical protein